MNTLRSEFLDNFEKTLNFDKNDGCNTLSSEEALNTRYKSIIDAIIDNEACFVGLYDLTRTEKQYVFVSNGCRRILGYEPREVLERGFELAVSMIHEDDLERLYRFNVEMNQEFRDTPIEVIRSKVFSCENRIQKKTGEIIWMRSHSQLLTKTESGEPQLVFFINTDVTREKELDIELIEKTKSEKNLIKHNAALEVQQAQQKSAIMEMELATLRMELGYKEKELLRYAMSTASKNELLSEVHDVLRRFRNADPEALQNELNKKLWSFSQHKSVEEEWESFQLQFNSINPEFNKTILQRCPELTKTELSIVSMLRLQMQPKDIARFKYVSLSNIQNHIGRIRRKLGLRRNQNVTKYLAEL